MIGIRPMLEELGFTCTRLTHPGAPAPFLFAERKEGEELPTILGYGHGDVVRGLDVNWSKGLSPWALTEVDGGSLTSRLRPQVQLERYRAGETPKDPNVEVHCTALCVCSRQGQGTAMTSTRIRCRCLEGKKDCGFETSTSPQQRV